jgi:hypothetical protein
VALILVCWQQMRTWLRLVLITEMKLKNKPSELIFPFGPARALSELAAQRTGGRRMNPSLLLLGLFSS